MNHRHQELKYFGLRVHCTRLYNVETPQKIPTTRDRTKAANTMDHKDHPNYKIRPLNNRSKNHQDSDFTKLSKTRGLRITEKSQRQKMRGDTGSKREAKSFSNTRKSGQSILGHQSVPIYKTSHHHGSQTGAI